MSCRGWELYLEPHSSLTLPERAGFVKTPLWNIHVASLSDRETCEWVIHEVEAHTKAHGWTTARHAWHPTTDMPVSAIPALARWAQRQIKTTIFPTIACLFGFETGEFRLRDLFVVRYRVGGGSQDRLALHRDGNLLSFNVLLSNPREFDGGGTAFPAMAAGPGAGAGAAAAAASAALGKLLHEGVRVTAGTRYIIVGFIDVDSPKLDQAFLSSKLPNQSKGGVEGDYRCVTRAYLSSPRA